MWLPAATRDSTTALLRPQDFRNRLRAWRGTEYIFSKYNIFADQGILVEAPYDGGWLGVADNGGCQSGKWVAGWAGAGLR